MSSLSLQLSFKSRHKLSQVLDQVNVRGCDWRSLVEEMGFSYEMVMLLRDKPSPTMALLEEWELKMGSEATLDSLIEKLDAIGNQPAVDILASIKEQNSTKPLPVSPRGGSPYGSPRGSVAGSSSPQLSPKSSSGAHRKDSVNTLAPPSYSAAFNIDDNMHLTQRLQSLGLEPQNDYNKQNHEEHHTSKQLPNGYGDTAHNGDDTYNGTVYTRYGHSGGPMPNRPMRDSVGQREMDLADQLRSRSLSDLDRSLLSGTEFDVFLSYAPEDYEFAEEMRLRLSYRGNISVYSPSEGLMPGQSFQDEIADKIKRGCRKTIVILSPDYNTSPWCAYEARLAHHKSPDPRNHVIIPVMYRKCQVPDFIAYLFYLDFPRYKNDPRTVEQYFWDRLIKSVHLRQR